MTKKEKRDLKRRYFIMDVNQAPHEDALSALNMCIGVPETQSYSVDGSKLSIKTTEKEIKKILLDFPEYTFSQILELTFTVEKTFEEWKLIILSEEFTANYIESHNGVRSQKK